MDQLFASFVGALIAIGVVGLAAFLLRSAVLNWAVDRMLIRLLKDKYSENLWDLAVGMTRVSPHTLMELELRAESGTTLERPLGAVRRYPHLTSIAFNPAQLIRQPLGPEAPVDLSVLLGPRAKRPLRLRTPIMVSGMGYGIALSRSFVVAVARGASRAGAAYNAGSGPVLDEVLDETKHLILQYSGGAWNRDPSLLAEADMVEIRYGHGGRAALGQRYAPDRIPAEARRLMVNEPAAGIVYEAPLPGAATPSELRQLVPELRQLLEGGPVGVKLAATHDLEQELSAVLEAGVDVIAIDGCQGGTHGSPPVIADDFGIPTVFALFRAVRFLEQTGSRKEVSLVAGGGLQTPGDFLKALALGADAVYAGTVVMMSATHGSISRSVPFEPVTQLVWADGKKTDQFDLDKGARGVANFLTACGGEMEEALRALGKRNLKEVSREDLVALDRETSAVLDLQPAWRAPAGYTHVLQRSD